MTKQFTLGKDERLKSRKQTELLFSSGKKFSIHPFRIFYITHKTAATGTRFGIGVSTKLFKRSVDRNRVKRLVREAWRLQKTSLHAQLMREGTGMDIFFIYIGKELPVYQDVFERTGKVIAKLSQLSTELT